MEHYQAYLIDLDGTMYKDTDEIDGATQFIDYLNNNHILHLYVANNSIKTPVQVTEKLREMHIDTKPDGVVASALATADYISRQHPNATVYMIGGHGLEAAPTDAGLSVKDDEHVSYIVIGLDRKVTYKKLSIATLAVRNGAKSISTNSDISIPRKRSFLLGNGAITSMVSVSTGIQPEFISKPGPIITSKSLDILGLEKSEVVVVGGLYDAGIILGISVGIDTIHVQTGMSTYEDVQPKEIPPTYSFKDLDVAVAELEK